MAQYQKPKPLQHPMDIVGKFRLIQWARIPINTEFEFILTAFPLARAVPYSSGGYLNCSAKPFKDYPLFQINVGEHLILQFSYKTFLNCLVSLPRVMQKQCSKDNMAEYDDLYIKFKKIDRKNMQILNLERKQGTEDQIDEIEDMYDMI